MAYNSECIQLLQAIHLSHGAARAMRSVTAMSLREKKKAITREAILDAAEDLFATQGYVATTIEQIAERAMVAVGTMYNYFASKSQLLLALNERDTEALLARGQALVDEPPEDPVTGCCDLLWLYLEAVLEKYDRPLMREMWSAAVTGGPDLTKEFLSLDELLIEQLAELMRVYERDGRLAASLPVGDAAWVLYGVVSSVLIVYLTVEEIDADAVRARIDRLVPVAFADWRSDR
ncbi:MAG: TetR family transcriptional regulator [Armatimonadia bacterium]|nr:TetR family transcriptional regulator [Armatimonadia bacterium]